MNIEFDPIEEVLEEIRQGHLVIVTDDANRENEGDLILAAEKATPELINFMIRYTSGVICVPMEGKDLDRLELPLMTLRNTESMRTAYTISVDAKRGGDDWHLGCRSVAHDSPAGGSGHRAPRSGASGSCLPAPIPGRRRPPTCRAHGSGCRSCEVSRSFARRRVGGGGERRRFHGEIARPDRF